MLNTRRFPMFLATFCALAATGGALAGISSLIFDLQATNGNGTATYQASFNAGDYDPVGRSFTWTLGGPVALADGVTPVAMLNSAALTVDELGQIDFALDVTAGASDTTFTVHSAQLSFSGIPDALTEGRTFANFALTDTGADTARLFGVGTPGTGAYRAYYNGDAPDGTRFSHLVAIMFASGGTSAANQSDPPSGFRDIAADLYDIRSELAFVLTANDRVAATTTFEIVPEPGTAGLLVLAGLLLARRRGN